MFFVNIDPRRQKRTDFADTIAVSRLASFDRLNICTFCINLFLPESSNFLHLMHHINAIHQNYVGKHTQLFFVMSKIIMYPNWQISDENIFYYVRNLFKAVVELD
jgi:hypothetical protein